MRAWAAALEIVADIARREFGVRYHADHIGRALRTLGGSPRKPERLAREADEAAIPASGEGGVAPHQEERGA